MNLWINKINETEAGTRWAGMDKRLQIFSTRQDNYTTGSDINKRDVAIRRSNSINKSFSCETELLSIFQYL